MKLGKYDIDNVYNEDCYEAIKNIPDKSVDLIVTDPPYEMSCGGMTGIFKYRIIYIIRNSCNFHKSCINSCSETQDVLQK